MKKSRFTEEQIAYALKQAELGTTEPPRFFRRLQLLRRWSHEQDEVFSRSA